MNFLPPSENIQNLPSSKCGKICVTVRNIALELHMDLNQCHKLAAQNRFNRVVPYHSPEIRCRKSLELYLSCHPSIAQINLVISPARFLTAGLLSYWILLCTALKLKAGHICQRHSAFRSDPDLRRRCIRHKLFTESSLR